jgi:signal transduction histidine kinase
MVIWDVAQQLQIRSLRQGQLHVDREAYYRDQRQESRAEELEERVDQILLVTEALYRLCKDRLDISDDDLRATLQTVLDEQAAKADSQPSRCASCGAAVLRDQVRCQYCGTDTGHTPELFG